MSQAGWDCSEDDVVACSDYRELLRAATKVRVQETEVTPDACTGIQAEAFQLQVPELSATRCCLAFCGAARVLSALLRLHNTLKHTAPDPQPHISHPACSPEPRGYLQGGASARWQRSRMRSAQHTTARLP